MFAERRRRPLPGRWMYRQLLIFPITLTTERAKWAPRAYSSSSLFARVSKRSLLSLSGSDAAGRVVFGTKLPARFAARCALAEQLFEPIGEVGEHEVNP